MRDNTSDQIVVYKVTETSEIDLSKPSILIDTGATANIICNEQYFTNFDSDFKLTNNYLELADGSKHSNLILGKGTASIPITDRKGKLRHITLNNALFIPSFCRNIMSLSSAVRDGASFDLNTRGKEHMKSSEGHIFQIDTRNNLYILNTVQINSVIAKSAEDWHRIFGHTHLESICKLPDGIDNLKITNKSKSKEVCEPCVMGKMERTFNRVKCPRVDKPFKSVFCDLNGPIKEECEYKYVFGFIDDFTGYLAIYLLKSKDESPDAFKQFLADHNYYGKTSKLRSDSGGEFNSKVFKKICIDNTIKFETSCPSSSFQNGRIERCWKTLFNMAPGMLFDSGVNVKLFPYILRHACFIMNRTYSDYLKMTPIEAALKKRPDANDIHLFGSLCYGYQHHIHKTKFEPRAKPAIYIGQDPLSPAHLLYYPEQDIIRRTRCVKFTGNMYYNCKQLGKHSDLHEHVNNSWRPSTNESDTESVSSDMSSGHTPPADHTAQGPAATPQSQLSPRSQELRSSPGHPHTSRYPERRRQVPDRLGIEQCNDHIDFLYHINSLDIYCKSNIIVPKTYQEAITSEQSELWIASMQREIDDLVANKTYTLVPLPPGQKLIGGRWVFALKFTPPSKYRFKSRFCAKGFSQRPGVNYDVTYAPTARITTIRMLLNIAIQLSLILHQLDVNNAFLNSDIDYDIYMRQPEGFVQDPSLVCKLNKSIYGLKQSAMLWNKTILDFMSQQNLTQSAKDPCLFIRKDNSNILYVLIWVDDIIVASSNNHILQEFKCNFAKNFKIKDIGPLSWFLGIAFCQTSNSITMNQTVYIKNILERFGMTDCKPRSLPCDPNIHKLLENYSPLFNDPTYYRELVGSLIYLYCCTRPDLSFVVSLLSRFMAAPKVIHVQIANDVLNYLKYTVNYDLKYVKSNDPLRIYGYTDSDYAQSEDCHSISGYCYKLNLNSALISWRSAKQTIVAQSTTEAEYISAGEAVKEALFLRELFAEFYKTQPETVTIFCDNVAAMAITNTQQFHKRTKHIGVAYHAIRTYVANKSVFLTYIASKDNLADLFTKALHAYKLKRFAIIRGTDEHLDR